ncbi:MAG: hypothetical protein ACYC6N_06715 [Pirellulaceae bacterium]
MGHFVLVHSQLLDELWRGELDLELTALEQLRAQHLQVHKKLKALALFSAR